MAFAGQCFSEVSILQFVLCVPSLHVCVCEGERQEALLAFAGQCFSEVSGFITSHQL